MRGHCRVHAVTPDEERQAGWLSLQPTGLSAGMEAAWRSGRRTARRSEKPSDLRTLLSLLSNVQRFCWQQLSSGSRQHVELYDTTDAYSLGRREGAVADAT
jgi:hypothetical protein